MQFAWENRELLVPIPPEVKAEPQSFWDNLLYHGIGDPLVTAMVRCFYEDGQELRNLGLSRSVSRWLHDGDLVLNLNYDTVFEIALKQEGRVYSYSPNRGEDDAIVVCKPHGSLNMNVTATGFGFSSDPEWLGMPQATGGKSYTGLIPPKVNKSYEHHPIALQILKSVSDRRPKTIAMWGLGLTDGDVGLLDLYSAWAQAVEEVVIVNPDDGVAKRVESLFKRPARHFKSAEAWLEHQR